MFNQASFKEYFECISSHISASHVEDCPTGEVRYSHIYTL